MSSPVCRDGKVIKNITVGLTPECTLELPGVNIDYIKFHKEHYMDGTYCIFEWNDETKDWALIELTPLMKAIYGIID